MTGMFPPDLPVKIHSLRSRHQTFVSHSHALRRQARSRGGHVWQFTIETPPLRRADWQRVFAFSVKQKGRYDTFTMVPKVFSSPLGKATGTPLVNGSSQTGQALNTKGWTPDTLVLKAGDFIKLANTSKVYMLTADATSDATGNATLAIEPALLVSPAHNESLVVRDIPFTVAFVSDLRELHVDELGYATYQADVEEVL